MQELQKIVLETLKRELNKDRGKEGELNAVLLDTLNRLLHTTLYAPNQRAE